MNIRKILGVFFTSLSSMRIFDDSITNNYFCEHRLRLFSFLCPDSSYGTCIHLRGCIQIPLNETMFNDTSYY